jgi:hypothetical protein
VKHSRALLILFLVVLALAAVAGGATRVSGGPQIKYNAADEYAARAAVVRRGDLQHSARWSGYFQKPSTAELHPNVCSNFHPDASDLVVTGAETSTWTNSQNPLSALSSKATVFQTAHMATLDWQRTMQPSAAVSCLARVFTQGIGATLPGKLISFKSVSHPRIAPSTAAFRALYELESKPVVSLVFNVVYASRSRTQIWVAASSVEGSVPSVSAQRLARIVVGRIRA